MVVTSARCQLLNPQPKLKMPTKKKSPAKKLKVELKDLRPRKDAKAGGALTTLCAKGLTIAPPVNKEYCTGPVG